MSYHDARILFVDVERLCCDTISIDGNFYTEDVSYSETGLRKSGKLGHPEIGDVCVVETDEDGGSGLSKWYVARTMSENNLTKFMSGYGGNLNLNKQLPGDQTFSGPDGAFLSLLRGKLTTIGSSPLAQTIYAGFEGLIRTVCQNYDAMGSGFRVFSINSGDEVITRLCFSGSDRNFINGALENEDATSENFEYQIDFTKEGMTIFVGDIDPITKKRNPNLTITLKPSGDIQVICGKNMVLDLFSNGIINTTITDSDNKIVYDKLIGVMGNELLYKEIIKGDVVRQIDGNLYEDIKGIVERKAEVVRTQSDVIENTSRINRKTTGINITELDSNPKAGIRIK